MAQVFGEQGTTDLPANPPRVSALKSRLCVISPCYNEAPGIADFVQRLAAVADGMPDFRWEFILVDDGSHDDSLQCLKALSSQEPRLTVVALSRNFGHQSALSAGISLARGDAIICLDSDLQHPPELIPQMVGLWQQGFDLVSMVRISSERAGWLKRCSSWLFYKLLNAISDTPVPAGVADFFLASRPVYRALRRCPERHRFVRGLVSWVGFRRTFLEYRSPPRNTGASKYGLPQMWKLATDAAFAFSTSPIRLMSRLGVGVSGLGLLYLGYVLVRRLVHHDVVPGWASTLGCLLILGGLNLLFMGILGEYVARVYEEVKARPVYLVREVFPSRARRRRRPAGSEGSSSSG